VPRKLGIRGEPRQPQLAKLRGHGLIRKVRNSRLYRPTQRSTEIHAGAGDGPEPDEPGGDSS
jgi:hypothetical protein